ncbi:MAG: 3-keto-5-aminohexanoate cleavage protein [Cypionkella sp.]
MILQACLNGARPAGYHPALPLSLPAMVADARAVVAAGANELHIHPRDASGRESLHAVTPLMQALRPACPGTLIGVSTGAWIEADAAQTRTAIAGWQALPDYASVNLSEPDAPAVIALLTERCVGVEAGLATPACAERLVTLPQAKTVFRILIEVENQNIAQSEADMTGILEVLAHARITRQILLHGFDSTIWHFVSLAAQRGFSTRIGLEDGRLLPDGSAAPDNAAMIRAAQEVSLTGLGQL